MAVVPAPAFRIRSIEWTLDRPAQVNVSAYTGRRKAVANPWHGKWRARVEMAPLVGSQMREMRAFFASLRGRINTFYLPATEGPQHSGSNPTLAATANAGATSVSLSGATSSEPGMMATFTLPSGNRQLVVIKGSPNLIPEASRDITTWSQLGTTNPAQAGAFVELTDDNNAAWEASSLSVTASSGTNTFAIKVRKDNIGKATRYALVRLVSDDSQSDVSLDTSTGEFHIEASGPGHVGGNVSDGGDSWNVTVIRTVSGASVQPWLFPAAGATSGTMGTHSPTATGTTGFKEPQVFSANSITFEPPLRETVVSGTAIETANPFAEVAMAEDITGWRADLGPIYGIAFDVEEAF